MSRSSTVEAIVLKTYDVGEADRYCILFTRERGRMAARAHGVRKLQSRKSGSLLPLQRVMVEVREGKTGLAITSASRISDHLLTSIAAFAPAMEGIEVLLRLIQDEEPLPPVFDATLAFLQACDAGIPYASLAYRLRLLHLLGFLPDTDEMHRFFVLTETEEEFIQAARDGYFLRESRLQSTRNLELVCMKFLQDQLAGPLKVPGVMASLRQDQLWRRNRQGFSPHILR